MSFEEILDLTAGVYFSSLWCIYTEYNGRLRVPLPSTWVALYLYEPHLSRSWELSTLKNRDTSIASIGQRVLR